MLREGIYRYKRLGRTGFRHQILKSLLAALLVILFAVIIIQAVKYGSSRQLMHLLLQQEFPFEAILLEGAPGLSAPERDILDQTRKQGMAVGMYLLTGVNISDPRTFFLSYFSPPPNGPGRIGWAYYPNDPEFEGPILEPVPQNPPRPENTIPPTFDSKEILVGIYHTHNNESYAGDGGGERDEEGSGEIIKVGEILTEKLNNKGIRSIQSKKDHEGTDFNTAYTRSYETAVALLKENPTMQLLFDVHRDGLPPGMKSTVKVKGKDSSRILVVIGQINPNWKKNEAFALELMALADKKYPGLFLPKISYAADARYNQHLTQGALLLEFGSQLNTLEEATIAAEAFADVVADWVRQRVEQQTKSQ